MNQTVKEHTFPSGQQLQLAYGDITDETVGAIVNAANAHLSHGAGVAGAILSKGGRQIQAESDQWVKEHGTVSHAEPAYTRAGNLPCQYVIHAVGPIWSEGEAEEKLEAAIWGSLSLADRLGVESIALPAISTGIYRFPVRLAAHLILATVERYITAHPSSKLRLVRLVLFEPQTQQAFFDEWEDNDHLHT